MLHTLHRLAKTHWTIQGFTKGLLSQLASEQVPFSVALSRTVKTVITQTRGEQRPYIATDMNGDVYFRIAPPNRQRRALVITIDRLGEIDLPGARADGQAWPAFFKNCKFDVQSLRNPQRDDVIAALYNARIAGVSVPASMTVTTGAGPLPPDASPGPLRPTKVTAMPNSFFAFYFTGYGFRINDTDFLAMVDHPQTDRLEERQKTLCVRRQ